MKVDVKNPEKCENLELIETLKTRGDNYKGKVKRLRKSRNDYKVRLQALQDKVDAKDLAIKTLQERLVALEHQATPLVQRANLVELKNQIKAALVHKDLDSAMAAAQLLVQAHNNGIEMNGVNVGGLLGKILDASQGNASALEVARSLFADLKTPEGTTPITETTTPSVSTSEEVVTPDSTIGDAVAGILPDSIKETIESVVGADRTDDLVDSLINAGSAFAGLFNTSASSSTTSA